MQVKVVKCMVGGVVVDISANQLGGLATVGFLEEVRRAPLGDTALTPRIASAVWYRPSSAARDRGEGLGGGPLRCLILLLERLGPEGDEPDGTLDVLLTDLGDPQVDRLVGRGHLFKRSIILVKAWCYYEARILGAHRGLFSSYALETLVLYVFNVHHKRLQRPLDVRFGLPG